jgi:hypothetical protein
VVRLRQAVLAAREIDPVVAELRSELGLGEGYEDPGVAMFGLRNRVLALGDAFIEVVSPAQDGTTAGRYLDRQGGDAGYMVMFQIDDLEGARARAKEMGIRVVWEMDLPDISGTHLHPADMRGAIVSLDRPDPAETWHWAGPDWTGQAGTGAPGRLEGVRMTVAEPVQTAERWARVLGVEVSGGEPSPRLELDGSFVAFDALTMDDSEKLADVVVSVPEDVRRGRAAVEIGGARFALR